MARKVQLMSSDKKAFEVNESVAFQSTFLKNTVEDRGTTSSIELPNISSEVLAKVIKYCTYHVESQRASSDGKPIVSEDEIKQWDVDFMKVDEKLLFDLILAAHHFDIKKLVDLGTDTVADKIRDYPLTKIQALFGI